MQTGHAKINHLILEPGAKKKNEGNYQSCGIGSESDGQPLYWSCNNVTCGPGIDEPIAVTKSSLTCFSPKGGLGTVTELTDTSGSVVKAYVYDA